MDGIAATIYHNPIHPHRHRDQLGQPHARAHEQPNDSGVTAVGDGPPLHVAGSARRVIRRQDWHRLVRYGRRLHADHRVDVKLASRPATS
jgi:pSer/pThr/pTyr-binding forkhead associated (FHA) protein